MANGLPAAFAEVAHGVLTLVLPRLHEEVGEIKGGVETDGEGPFRTPGKSRAEFKMNVSSEET